MKREVTVAKFVEDLLRRIEHAKTIDCCKEELKTFAQLAARKIPDEKLTVEWRDE